MTLKLSERDINGAIRDFLALDDWHVFLVESVSRREWGKGTGEPGMPDIQAIRYDPERQIPPEHRKPVDNSYAQILWVEGKRKGGKAQANQIAWHLLERKRGALVVLLDEDCPATIEGFILWYRGSGLLRKRGL